MIPLHIALVHRPHWYNQEPRIDGHFAYEVPGLTWEHINVEREFSINLKPMTNVDAVWLDDGKYDGISFTPSRKEREAPIVYRCLWPTLAPDIFQTKQRIARAADLVLLDHDDLERWETAGFQARRLAYAVNERYYRDRGLRRDIDVGFYCVWEHSPARPAFAAWLKEHCRRKGWVYWDTKGQSVRTEYASLLARTKVVVHLNRTGYTRPARIFDCAASGAAFLSNVMPRVSGEHWQNRVHYVAFAEPWDEYDIKTKPRQEPFTDRQCEEVVEGLEYLLEQGAWEAIAQNAKQYVLACHTWEKRSWELRGLLLDSFPRLRAKVGEGWAYQP